MQYGDDILVCVNVRGTPEFFFECGLLINLNFIANHTLSRNVHSSCAFSRSVYHFIHERAFARSKRSSFGERRDFKENLKLRIPTRKWSVAVQTKNGFGKPVFVALTAATIPQLHFTTTQHHNCIPLKQKYRRWDKTAAPSNGMPFSVSLLLGSQFFIPFIRLVPIELRSSVTLN